jgi:S-adenosylmethionine synthetase
MLAHLARMAVRDIGYDQEGFSWRNAAVECHLHAQSPEIAMGVDAAGNKDEGAGDQGIMFGYACRETPELMPAPLYYAHLILRRVRDMRRAGDHAVKGLLPDAKSQVTLRYVDGKPVGCTSIVVSTQHEEDLEQAEIKRMLRPIVEGPAAVRLDVPGRRVLREPDGQVRHRRAGRRLRPDRAQDHRGHLRRRGPARRRRLLGQGPDQGGPLRRLRLPLPRQERGGVGLADRCTIQVSYAIGVSKPLSVYFDLHGTGRDVDEAKLARVVGEMVNLRRAASASTCG